MNPLLEKHLHATLTADEAAALALALAENPALADEFAAATRMENELRSALKEQAHTALYTRRMERAAEEAEPEVRRRSWIRPMAAAAAVALVGGGGWAFLESQQPLVAENKPAPRKPSATLAALPREESGAFPANTSRTDATALKRKLRRFAASSAPSRGVPVSQALRRLESEWKACAHRDARDNDISFTIADAALKSWAKPEDEPQVALEIPGISLLTSVEVIAAQAGLKATVTPAGLTLEPETRKDDGQPRTWHLPLAAATLSRFITRAGKETERVRQEFVQNNANAGFSLVPMMDSMDLKWMERAVSTDELVWSRLGASGLIREDVQTSETGPDLAGDELQARIVSESDTLAPWLTAVDHDGILQLDSSTSQQNGTAGAQGFRLNEVAINPDGQTIDLNIAPEVVEFSGFLNYGEPFQTTGINALGLDGSIVLTDSKITQPVFATRVLYDHPASLTRLLSAHGANSAGLSWDAENGTVTARGTLRELRAASATLAAVRESATAGVVVEAKFFEWPDGVVQGIAAAPGSSQIVSATEAADFLKKMQVPGASTLVSYPRVVSAAGQPVKLESTTDIPMPDGSQVPIGTTIQISETSLQGMAVHAKLNLVTSSVAGTEIKDGKSWPVPSSTVLTSDLNLRFDAGETFRADIAGSANNKPTTLLLTVRPAAVP